MATTSKTSTFEVPKIFSDFFSPSFGWVLPVAWSRAAAPEATHRCTWQPTKAVIPWSSGSSRRRRPWMHRTTRAVASEEDLGGKLHEALGFRCEEVYEDVDRSNVSWILFITSYGKCASVPKHLHQHFVLFFVITIVSSPTPQ